MQLTQTFRKKKVEILMTKNCKNVCFIELEIGITTGKLNTIVSTPKNINLMRQRCHGKLKAL